jgi:RNA polymerase sigma-70 factor (ECF subfamily)
MTVIASRIANKLRDAEKPVPDDSEEILGALPGQGMDPELDLTKRRHQAEFREAVREALSTLSTLSTLSDHERQLLRLRFVDGLSTHDLAKLFRVNPSTVSRWLASVLAGL